MTIEEYLYGTYYNHKPKAERKPYEQRNKKLKKEAYQRTYHMPLKLFIDNGFAKLDIASKEKSSDKRETIKDRDNKRN